MNTYGPTFDPDLDGQRIVKQMDSIRNEMLAASIRGRWQTLDEIQEALEAHTGKHYPTPSISAQLRHLRKPQFGNYRLEKRRRTVGLYEYKLSAEVKVMGRAVQLPLVEGLGL